MAEPVSLQTLLTYLTLISVPVGVFYHIMTLRNSRKSQELALRAQEQALETRQAQMFMNLYQQTFQPAFISAWNTFAAMEWSNYEEFREAVNVPENRHAIWIVGSFFEGLGVIVKEELLHIRLVAELMTGMTRVFWEKVLPAIEEGREKGWAGPRWYSESEFLYNKLMKYLEEHPELKT